MRNASNGAARAIIRAYVSAALAVVGIAILILANADPAQAVPAFARQTGQPCGACHTAIPELRPFGRLFKLGGYQQSDGEMLTPQLALWTLQGFTNTRSAQDTPPLPRSKTNNNLDVQELHAVIGGKIAEGLGGLFEWRYNPYTGHLNFDDSDLRYVKTVELFGKEATLGLTINNAPSFQDVWNTTNSWAWPQFKTNFAANTVPGVLIDNMDQEVGGAGMYLWWNNMLYLEATGYRGFNRATLRTLGEFPTDTPDTHPGTLPYWRAALEPHWGDHYLMIGTFGMYGMTVPGGAFGTGTDRYLDIGFDSQYQYDGDDYQFTLKAADVIEKQRLDSSFAQGLSTNPTDWINSFKLNATSIWDHTYALSGGYFNVRGSSDAAVYSQSTTGSPNGDGLMFDASYFPFSKGHAPGPDKEFNMRIGVQYTKYLHLYGGTTNAIAGPTGAISGTRNANGNDTVWLYVLTAF